jgi:hypothetical protein
MVFLVIIVILGQFQCMPETWPSSTQTSGFLLALGYGRFQFLSTVAFVGSRGVFPFWSLRPFMNLHHFNESNPFNMTSVHKLVQCQCCSGLTVSGEVHQDHLQQPTLSLRGFAVSRSWMEIWAPGRKFIDLRNQSSILIFMVINH